MAKISKFEDYELIDELIEREVLPKHFNGDKCPTDIWKDEHIAEAYNELTWEEWRDTLAEAIAKKKGKKS